MERHGLQLRPTGAALGADIEGLDLAAALPTAAPAARRVMRRSQIKGDRAF